MLREDANSRGREQAAFILQSQRQAILDSWLSEIKMGVRAARNKDYSEVRDHLPALLDQVIAQVAEPSGEYQPAPASVVHAAHRVNLADYSLADVLEEFHLLRRTVTRFLWPVQEHDPKVLFKVWDIVDRAIIASVTRYEALTTELRLREASLVQTNARKDEFIALMSHELRNPLSAIMWASQLLDDDGEDQEEARNHAFGVIKRQTEVMLGLIEDLLDVSAIVRGTVLVKSEKTSVTACLQKASEMLLEKAARKGIALHFEQDPEAEVYATADPLRLQQVIVNIIGNAIKYSPAYTKVFTTTTCHHDKVEIQVRDEGIGMSADEIVNVFEPFYRVDKTLARTDGGLGLGLYLAHKLMAMMGGEVAAASPGKGLGATFTLSLPLHRAGDTAPSQQASPLPTHPPCPDKSVLIVEDKVDLADMMAANLKRLGCAAEIAYDAEQGLALAHQKSWLVILIDIGLPKVDGFHLVKELRRLSQLQDSLFIAMSGYGQAEDIERSLRAGFHRHFTKPVDTATLIPLINTHYETVVQASEGHDERADTLLH